MSIYDDKGKPGKIIQLDEERRKRLSFETIEAIKYISAKGSPEDLDTMAKLLLLKEDALRIIREETDTSGWTKLQYEDASMQLVVYLANEIKESLIIDSGWFCGECASFNFKGWTKCEDCEAPKPLWPISK